MKPRPFNLLAMTSLAAFVAVIALWARSFASETILLESYQGQWLLIGADGPPPTAVRAGRDAFSLDRFLMNLTGTTPWNGGSGSPPAPETNPSLGLRMHRGLGFLLIRGTNQVPGVPWEAFPFWIVGIPYWFLALLAAAVPARWLWLRARSARRRSRGLCPSCGYDLRASPHQCPECGKAVPAPSTIAA